LYTTEVLAKMIKTPKTVFSTEEVAKHSTENDCWVIVDGKVFDVTNFLREHPGGKRVLLREAGKDATEKFRAFHGPSVLSNYEAELCIGQVGSEEDMEKYRKKQQKKQFLEAMGGFGALIPYGDPSWYVAR
jgi:cytochrome b involved in lipid metabolism